MKRSLTVGGLLGGVLCLTSALSVAEGLAKIEVTAERIGPEDPQTLPLAVNVMDRETLREAAVTEVGDVARHSPGLALSSFNVGQATPYIRGIGSNEDGAGGDPSVGVFLDEVYLGRSAAWAADLFGMERIEVLRGPQGTLYGRNVVGGAINLVTRKPGEERVREIEVALGTGGHQQVRFDLSGPMGEGEAYGGISGAFKRRDGYLESVTTGTEQLAQDRRGLRTHLTLFPTLQSELNLTADYAELDESGPNRHIEGDPKETLLVPLDAVAANDLRRNWDIDPGVSVGDFWGVTARLDHELENATLTTISAFRRSDLYVDDASMFDLEATASSPGFIPYDTTVTYGHNDYDEQAEQFSQELRLAGRGVRIDWLLGAYYLRESVFREEDFAFDVLLDRGVSYDGGRGATDQDNTTDSYAFFGQFGYDFGGGWRATAGGRWSRDRKEIRQQGTPGGFLILEDYDIRAEESWSRFTPKLSLDFQVTENLFTYASYSQGYKSGGFQGQAPTALAASTPFEPELADNYEIGLKWQSADRRLRLNATAFQTEYENLQVLELFSPADAPAGDLGVTMTHNAANARSRGLELEWSATPADGWNLGGSYAWLDAVYTDFFLDQELGFRFTNETDRTGNRLRNAPEHSLNLNLGYTLSLPSGGRLDTRLDWFYQSQNYQEPTNQEYAAVAAYDLANLRIAWRPDEQLEIAGWVHNLFDEQYMLHNYAVGDTGLATPGPPRTLGVTVRYDFGR